jgi:hypothetical protein
MKTTSRYPAVAKRRQPAQLGSGPAVMIAGSLLFAVTVFFQSPAHSAEVTLSATKIAELEKGFWICDYLGTKQGADLQQAATCVANYEELKQAKFDGDFEKLVAWWRLHKVAQHKALESAISAQVPSTQSIGALGSTNPPKWESTSSPT